MIGNFAVRSVLIVAVLVGLAACGGGGSGGSGFSITTGANSTLTYGYYLNSSGGISYYDPSSPATAPVQVAASPVYLVRPLNSGTYSGANRMATDIHTRTLVYSTGGKFWKVGNVKSTTTPTPVQVSNDSGLVYAGPASALLCDIQVYSDYANHDNSRIVYTVTNANAACGAGSDQIRVMPLNAVGASTFYANNNAQVLASIYDVTSGALSGFLLRDGQNVVKVATDFSNATTVDTVANTSASGRMLRTGKMFLVEDNGTNRVYKLYDPAVAVSGTNPSAALLTAASANVHYTVSAADSTLFIADASAGIIYRLPTDGSAAVTVASGETAGAIKSMRLTMNRVVYIWSDGTSTKIRAVDKTAVAATPSDLFTVLNTAIAANGVSFPDSARKDGLRIPARGLFFTVEYGSGNLKEACLMAEADGSTPACTSTTANEYWTGYNESSVFDFGSTIMSRVYRAADDGSNITLASYDVETGTSVATLASGVTLATGTLIKPQARANNYNATLFIGAGPDAWHANTGTASSLMAVPTATSATAIGNISAE